jgi:hypothetical protein
MKTFFAVILALPAVMAAPAPASAPDVAIAAAGKQVTACACSNTAGDTRVSGYCQYIAGGIVKLDGKDFVNIFHLIQLTHNIPIASCCTSLSTALPDARE